VQHEAIAPAVQPAPHVRASIAIIDLIAVADVEAVRGAVLPDCALDEPGKHFWKARIEPASVDPRGNRGQNVSTAARLIAARAIRVGRRNPIQDSSAMEEIVDQGINHDERRTDVEAGLHERNCRHHAGGRSLHSKSRHKPIRRPDALHSM
jgi:hypothetical protein